MPLARVRTSLSSIPEELKQQLQLAGYDIEVAAPGKKLSKPADLEITIESLPVREALASAGRASTIYVAPGAMRKAEPAAAPQRSLVTPIARVEPTETRVNQQLRDREQQLLVQRRAEQQAAETERLRREQERVQEENKRQRVEHQRLG